MKVYNGNMNMIVPDAMRVIPQHDVQSSTTPDAKSFQDVFNQTLDASRNLQFSKHASLRLNARDITLSNEQLTRVENGLNAARAKGIKDSLVLVDNVALVVNVGSKTVITALGNEKNNENIFTNIDGAVIV